MSSDRSISTISFSVKYSSLLISLCFCILICFSPAKAQISLDRISTAPTSDENGYVVRFHTSGSVDSFNVRQPTHDLVQLAIFGGNIDTTGIHFPEMIDPFDDITLHKIPGGFGIDVYLDPEARLAADVYPDGQSNHLLLSLTRSTIEELNQLTSEKEPVIWSKYLVDNDDVITKQTSDANFQQAASKADEDALGETYEKAKNKLKFDVVVIDPGHGGRDPGTIGYKGTKEKKVVLDVALKLGEYIKKYMPEVKVVYTRKEDRFVGLEERGHIANEAEGDLFISLHCNSYHNHRVKGSEVYFLGLHKSESAFEVMKRENSVIKLEEGPNKSSKLTENELLIYELANSGYMAISERIAGMIEHQFDDRAARGSRGVKQAGFIVLYHASMPAILTELGFLTNPSEQRFLTSDYGQSIMASAIFRAVRNYKEQHEESQNYNTK